MDELKELTLNIMQKNHAKTSNKPIANVIINLHTNGVSFCEIFELNKRKICNKFNSCTDCVDNFIKEKYHENQEK